MVAPFWLSTLLSSFPKQMQMIMTGMTGPWLSGSKVTPCLPRFNTVQRCVGRQLWLGYDVTCPRGITGFS